jgi:predicted MPP superfamily phosphohydrolase
MRPPVKRILRISIILILLFGAFCLIWGFFVEPNRLVLNPQTIQIGNWPPEFNGLRIAVIGDIHTDNRFIDESKLRQVVQLTNSQNPDLVVLLGDFIQGTRKNRTNLVEPEITAAQLKHLQAPLGVFAVLGNHDWWYDGGKVRRAFESEGIKVLEDEVAELNWRGRSFWLVGFGDLWTRPPQIERTIAKAPPGATIVAITHNPDIFPEVPETVSLLLAAHTHGGQVSFPLIGTPVVPSSFGAKYTAGHIFENGHHLFVTTGVGTSILRVRFRVPPEVAILTVTP